MTVSQEVTRETATGDGSKVAFAFLMKLQNSADMVVYDLTADDTTPLVENTDYTITIDTVNEGGTVTFTTAPANGNSLLFYRDMEYTQGSGLPATGPLPTNVIEAAIDRSVMLTQQLKSDADRSLKLSSTVVASISTTLPAASAGKALLWNATGTALINSTNNFDTIVTDATTQATAAAASATAAASSATAASTSQTAAAASATAAAASEAKAQDWAEEDEDVEVEPGEFSAYHWAQKSQAASGILSAKGDLLTHTGATNSRLPVGANNLILVSDNLEANGIKWAEYQDASTTAKGIAEIATSAEFIAGTDNSRIITPATLMDFSELPNLLASVTAAADSEAVFETAIDGTYDIYAFDYLLNFSADDNELALRVSTDGGATYKSGASDYSWSSHAHSTGAANIGGASAANTMYVQTTGANYGIGNAASEFGWGRIFLINPSSSTQRTLIYSVYGHLNPNGLPVTGFSTGAYLATTAVDGFKILPNTGNFTGTIKMHGLRRAA